MKISDFNGPKIASDGTTTPEFLRALHYRFVENANEYLGKFKDRDGNGKTFEIDEDNKHFYGTIIRYFARSADFYNSELIANEASLDKGLLICGNPGLGKTLIMRVLSDMPYFLRMVNNSFAMTQTHEIVSEYDQFGERSINHFFRGQRCFDDLGTEEKGSHYKTSDIFRRLIERRAELFNETKAKTHLTTNLGAQELFERYGDRVGSRFYEMFNIITIDGKDRRKL